jgi:hypothetical protein
MMNWQPITNEQKNGKPLLLWARMKSCPPEPNDHYPIVGFWHESIKDWKVYPEHLNRGEELIASHWTALPATPEESEL